MEPKHKIYMLLSAGVLVALMAIHGCGHICGLLWGVGGMATENAITALDAKYKVEGGQLEVKPIAIPATQPSTSPSTQPAEPKIIITLPSVTPGPAATTKDRVVAGVIDILLAAAATVFGGSAYVAIKKYKKEFTN